MTTKQLAAKLRPLLDSSEGTAEFLEGMQRVIEELYQDSADGCPVGFSALDSAIEAFRVSDENER